MPEDSPLRRRPVVLVDVQIGPVVLAVTVARRQRRGWLQDDLAEAVQEMALSAVHADREAGSLLR
ncbi:hypothetical protein [Falsiroseomonas sp. HW251]|uniref:hypothetical protein n=1 Tax=Falsiroseomonas sp. HW251 TaxID=3390998 RepID=UPI003D318463